MESQDGLEVAIRRIDACKQAREQDLDLSGLGLDVLPESISDLIQITELHLGGNSLTSVPEALGNLTQLTELNLSGNSLTSVPEALGNFTQLTELHLGGNSLTSVPEALGNLTQLTELNLSDNSLTSVPEMLRNLTQLTILDLSSNGLTSVPEALGNLTQLTELSLSGNGLTSVPEALGNLTQLTMLDLNENQLTSVPEGLSRLTRLTFLRLDINQLTSIPDFIGNLRELRRLDLDNNQLGAIPNSLGNLIELDTLFLYTNRLESIPDSLGNLAKLKTLHLGSNRLSILPDTLGDLVELSQLNLNDNRLSSISGILERLTELVDLDLAENELSSIPDHLFRLPKLTKLSLSGNNLRSVPEALGDLTNLEYLRLNHNQLTSLPESLGNLTELQILGLSGNQLTTIPEVIGGLTQLTELLLSDNRLESIPVALGNLSSLTRVHLGNNQLESIPDSFGDLAQLSELYLHKNRLTSIPETLGNLSGLYILDLGNNQLISIPETFGNLRELLMLDLRGNQLTSLPQSMGNLTALDALNLGGNQLTTPPPEIISAGARGVVSFLAEMASDPVRQWSSKIVVVGEGRVGKTSLLRALRGEPHDLHEASTHGLTVDNLDLPHPNPPDDDDVIMRLSTWDFGGQEIYHATHQFFLTDRSLFLLLWDAQIGWEGSKLHYWLDMIKARAPHAPVVLVATHLGPRPPDLPLTELKEAYPGLIVESLAADSQSRAGIEEVRECIRQQAACLPLMGATWPRRWLRAADAVRAADAKHVEPEKMYGLMAREGVTEEAHQQALTAALHSLGDLLYYPDDEELCDLVVLRPQWLTAYISRVLDSDEVLDDGGLFLHSLGAKIWHDVERPMRRHFIRMMENFDLSYRTEDQKGSLVVELLPWDPPPFQERWDALMSGEQRELRLRYRLHTVPPGIPTWFIAREHRFSTGLRWRSGALLRHPDGEHFGLVVVDRHGRTAELRVRGPYPHDFFAVLKDGFEQTLQRYPGLDIIRSVPCPYKDEVGNSCSHEFSHTQLVARLARKPPRETIECPEHLDDLDVRSLLQGIEPPAADRSEALATEALAKLDQLRLDVRQHHGEVQDRVDQAAADLSQEIGRTRAEVSAVFAEQQRAFLAEFRGDQSRNEVLCPSLIWVRRVNRRRIAGIFPGEAFQLNLCCEAPGEWHLLADVEPYECPAESEFTTSVLLPYVQRTLSVLKYVVPVFGAGLGMASEDLAKTLQDDIELMKSLLEGLPEDMRTQTGGSQVQSMVRAEDHAAYRRMYQLLKQLDPEEVWGGLNKVTTPEGHTYWLCREHAQVYRPSMAAIEASGSLSLPPTAGALS
ncbi:leucine-rich repeat domain-containing protein [Streptomyces mirabilis]|uniref:leucine-rich repeat domain-containing protein n=1 Tax=Streptomyces mirabilis TaxID=68239 RepID=UPI0036E7AC3C